VNSSAWNARYTASDLVWGVAANRFVVAETEPLQPGRALDLACGEGRNAVWLAERGWSVTGIDYADVAVERARRLAAARGLAVRFVVGDVLTEPLDDGAYDLVLLSYVQLPSDERATVLHRAAVATAPGGTVLLLGHDLRNHDEGHGGPKDPSVLWTAEEAAGILRELGLEVERAEIVLRDVDGAERPALDTLVRARRPG
jgi:SAM-dependent methyltransferase